MVVVVVAWWWWRGGGGGGSQMSEGLVRLPVEAERLKALDKNRDARDGLAGRSWACSKASERERDRAAEIARPRANADVSKDRAAEIGLD